jgi:hypothetical protein
MGSARPASLLFFRAEMQMQDCGARPVCPVLLLSVHSDLSIELYLPAEDTLSLHPLLDERNTRPLLRKLENLRRLAAPSIRPQTLICHRLAGPARRAAKDMPLAPPTRVPFQSPPLIPLHVSPHLFIFWQKVTYRLLHTAAPLQKVQNTSPLSSRAPSGTICIPPSPRGAQ